MKPQQEKLLATTSQEELLECMKSIGFQPQDLDELVLDTAETSGSVAANLEATPEGQESAIDDCYDLASQVNNGGLESQIAYLWENHGPAQTRLLLAELVEPARKKQKPSGSF